MNGCGVRLFELGISYDPHRTVSEVYWPFLSFLEAHPYDVVHIHSSKTTMMAIMAIAAKKAGVPKVIVHAHNGGHGFSLMHIILRQLGNLCMKSHVDLYCACSRSAAEWKFAKRYAAGAHIIKNGTDTKRFQFNSVIRKSMRNKLSIADDSFVIGNVGSLTEVKNQRFLLNVFSTIVGINNNTRLLIVGDGEDRQALETLTKEKELAQKVIFTGHVSDMERYLQAMDVFALPSLFEGLPIAAIEAQAAGLPVIASDRVSREMAITENVRFLPLEAGATVWAEKLLSFRGCERKDGSKAVMAAGYDIRETAETVRQMYLEQ